MMQYQTKLHPFSRREVVEIFRICREKGLNAYSVISWNIRRQLLKSEDIIFLVLTDKCNISCSYCYLSANNKNINSSKEVDDQAIEATNNFIRTCLTNKIKYRTLVLHGGETTLISAKVLAECINALYRVADTVSIQTNGIALANDEYIDDFVATIRSKERLVIDFSADGDTNIQSKQRDNTGGYTTKTLDNLKRHNIRTQVRVIVSKYAVDNLDALDIWLDKLTSEYGFDYALNIVSGTVQLSVEDKIKYAQWLVDTGKYIHTDHYTKGKGQNHGNACNITEIKPNGDIIPCNRVIHKPSGVIGNYNTDNWEELKATRETYFDDNNYEVHPDCQLCDIRDVCNAGCPMTRVNAKADDCEIKKVIYSQVPKYSGDEIAEGGNYSCSLKGFNPGKIFNNIGKTVGKAIGDVGKAVGKAAGDVGKAVKPIGDFIVDFAEDTAELFIDVGFEFAHYVEAVAKNPANILRATAQLGEGLFVAAITYVGDIFQNTYENILDPILGIDDGHFLGIGGSFGKFFGSATKDFFYDHAHETVAIIVLAAVAIVATIVTMGLATLAMSGLFSSLIAAAALIGILGVTALITIAAYNATMRVLSKPSSLQQLMVQAMKVEQLNEQQRMGTFSDMMSGDIFDKFAGGGTYNEFYAGGDRYGYDNKDTLGVSVGGPLYVGHGLKQMEFAYEDKAGHSQWAGQFNHMPLNTEVPAGDSGMSPSGIVHKKKVRDYNKKLGSYNTMTKKYNSKIDEYNNIVSDYNSLNTRDKSLKKYESMKSRLDSKQSEIDVEMKEIKKLQKELESFWK